MEKRIGKPTASAERNASVRAVVKAIVAVDFAGVQKDAAERLGFTKAGFGKFLSGRTGYGERMREALERYLRVPFDDIVAAGGDLAALRAKRTPRRDSVEVRFGGLPGWDVLLAGARALDPTVPAWCWRELIDARVWISQPVTAAMVADMARFILRHVPPPPDADSAHV